MRSLTLRGNEAKSFGKFLSGRSPLLRSVYGVAAALTLLTLALPASNLLGKEKKVDSRSVCGRVQDQAENPIDGATVTLKDLQAGKTFAAYTQGGGLYHFSDLKPNHDYEVQASHQGIASEVRQISSLDPRNKFVINLTIPPPPGS